MYLIYNNRMWGAWYGPVGAVQRLRQADLARQRQRLPPHPHAHLAVVERRARAHDASGPSASRATDYGPCRPRDLNWAYVYQRANHAGCPDYAQVHARKGASATKRALVKYSGAFGPPQLRGPAVSAVQAGAPPVADRAPTTAQTVAAVRRLPAPAPRLPGHRRDEPDDVAGAAGRGEVARRSGRRRRDLGDDRLADRRSSCAQLLGRQRVDHVARAPRRRGPGAAAASTAKPSSVRWRSARGGRSGSRRARPSRAPRAGPRRATAGCARTA